MSDKIELNRRRVLGGIATVGAASAALGAGTFAYFSDDVTSEDNEISAGTVDLRDPGNGDFALTDIAPGDSVPEDGTTTIESTYDGTVNPIHVDFSTSIAEPSESSNDTNMSASEFAQQLNVDTARLLVNGTEETNLTSSEGQNVSTLADFADLSIEDAFGDISNSDTVALEIAVTFDSEAGNDYQSDGVVLTVTFEAVQPNAP